MINTKKKKIIKLKNKAESGNGETLSFAFMGLTICMLMLFTTAIIQYTFSVTELTKALATISRSVAISGSYDEAMEKATKVAEAAITSSWMGKPEVTIEYISDEEVWEQGEYIKVTLTSNITTIEPYVMSGKRTATTVAVLEKHQGLDQDASIEDIYNYLVSQTWPNGAPITPAQACAILSCARHEASFDPYTLEWGDYSDQHYTKSYCIAYVEGLDNGSISRSYFLTNPRAYSYNEHTAGFGILQWTSEGERGDLYDYMKQNGYSMGSLEGQVNFMIQHLFKAWWSPAYHCHDLYGFYMDTKSAFFSSNSREDCEKAVKAFTCGYLRPAVWNTARVTSALMYYDEFCR